MSPGTQLCNFCTPAASSVKAASSLECACVRTAWVKSLGRSSETCTFRQWYQARRSTSSAARPSTASQPAHLSLFGFTAVETGCSASNLSVKALLQCKQAKNRAPTWQLCQVEKLKAVVPRWQQNSEAVAFKFYHAIPKGTLTQDAATNGSCNVHCNLQQCNSPQWWLINP